MYCILQDGKIFDYDLDFLTPLLTTFDAQLAKTRTDARQDKDTAEFGYLDRVDYLAGVGFTACQQYVTATRSSAGVAHEEAFSLGPHQRGLSVVLQINAGANYWKHHDQWPHEPASRRRSTVNTLATAGVDVNEAYVCSDLLDVIVGTAKAPFGRLKNFLVQWRGNLIVSVQGKNG